MLMEPLEEFDRLLGQTRRALEGMRATGKPATGDDDVAAPTRVVGTGAGGLVEVAMAGPRVEAVRLDPRVLRLGSEELGAQLTDAMNDALEQLRARAAGGAPGAPAVDPQELAGRLGDLQTDSIRSMAMMSQSLSDTVQRIMQAGR
jgi:DNA-binding protein YbaB